MRDEISKLRRHYSRESLLEESVAKDPIDQFAKWWDEAIASELIEPNAMILATASSDGLPSARTVLLKGFSREGFVFFTNYNSYKGQQLTENPKAALVFLWKELERQVRVTGLVEKLTDTANDNYFQSRPEESQVGAIVSPQSSVIESRDWLHDQFNSVHSKPDKLLQRPPHWGGYLVKPVIIEFWQGQPGRLHDRLQYTVMDDGEWKLERLAP
jgi:pyridoxamine 5'-phosphate oxidase